MKKSVSDQVVLEKILKHAKALGGIFTTADLYQLMGACHPIANQRAIKRFVDDHILTRIYHGVYVVKDFDSERLAQTLFPTAYFSLETVLIREGLIGALRLNFLSLVTYQRKTVRLFVHDKRIQIYSLQKRLYFGFKKNKQGLLVADREKAYLDLLYFYNRGYKFPIDPKNEVNISKIDQKKLKMYLKRYKNPKFVKFVKGILHG